MFKIFVPKCYPTPSFSFSSDRFSKRCVYFGSAKIGENHISPNFFKKNPKLFSQLLFFQRVKSAIFVFTKVTRYVIFKR